MAIYHEDRGLPYGNPLHPFIVMDSVADVLEQNILYTYSYLFSTGDVVAVPKPKRNGYCYVSRLLSARWVYAMTSQTKQQLRQPDDNK